MELLRILIITSKVYNFTKNSHYSPGFLLKQTSLKLFTFYKVHNQSQFWTTYCTTSCLSSRSSHTWFLSKNKKQLYKHFPISSMGNALNYLVSHTYMEHYQHSHYALFSSMIHQ
jgi:hypothetical protein